MLVAVPLAATLGVFVRFMIDQYQDSRLYRGLEANSRADDTGAND